MSRKQFIALLVALVVLVAATVAVWMSRQDAGAAGDGRIGKKLLPGFNATLVSELTLRDASGELHVVKTGNEWVLRERADYPVDASRVAGLLAKLMDAKVVQVENATNAERGRFQLDEPKAGAAADAAATTLELKDAAGKSMAQLFLGKKIMRRMMQPNPQGGPPQEAEVPVARFVYAPGQGDVVATASDALVEAEAGAAAWIPKELLTVDRVKSLVVTGADGKPRWALSRPKESDIFGFTAGAEKADPQKAQDRVSALYSLMPSDVIADPTKVDTGLDKPLTAVARTFDDLVYTFKIGAKNAQDLYPVSFTLVDEGAKTRVVEKKPEPVAEKVADKAEDKDKAADKDKAVDKDKAAEKKPEPPAPPTLAERVAKEQRMQKWTYLMPKIGVEPLLVERAYLVAEKKPAKAK